MHKAAYRVIEFSRSNRDTGEIQRWYGIEVRVRVWWKLYIGKSWLTLMCGDTNPEYACPYEVDELSEALEKINLLTKDVPQVPRWSKMTKAVISTKFISHSSQC